MRRFVAFFFDLKLFIICFFFQKDYGETKNLFSRSMDVLRTMRPQVLQPSVRIREESKTNFIRSEERDLDYTGRITVEDLRNALESLENEMTSKSFEMTRFFL